MLPQLLHEIANGACREKQNHIFLVEGPLRCVFWPDFRDVDDFFGHTLLSELSVDAMDYDMQVKKR